MSDTWIDTFNKNFENTFKDKHITPFIDNTGYSLIDSYSGKLKAQMGVSKTGSQVPFFKFYIDNAQSINDSPYVPLIITVSVTTAVNEQNTIRYMLNDSTIKRLKPIDITSRDDFFISKNDGQLYKKKRKNFTKVALIDIYKRMYRVHTSNIKTVRGVFARGKIFILRRMPSLILADMAWILGFILWFLKGKRYTYDVITERYLSKKGDKREIHATEAPPDNIDFFGYKVSIWTLFTYSLIVLLIYILDLQSIVKFLPKNSQLSGIFTIALAILSMVTFDKLLPLAIRLAVKYSANVAFNFKYKGIKLKI